MEAKVTVAVVVYSAAVSVVVYVTTTVLGSVLVLRAALGVHALPRSVEGVAHLMGREVIRSVGALGVRGSVGMVLWLDGDGAVPLTARTAGVGSLSALATAATVSESVDMAVTGALVGETIAVS